jgi:hypothetical protein
MSGPLAGLRVLDITSVIMERRTTMPREDDRLFRSAAPRWSFCHITLLASGRCRTASTCAPTRSAASPTSPQPPIQPSGALARYARQPVPPVSRYGIQHALDVLCHFAAARTTEGHAAWAQGNLDLLDHGVDRLPRLQA